MSRPVSIVLIGAGNRGRGIFGQYALDVADKAKFVGVVEPDRQKRELFASLHNITANMCFESHDELFSAGKKSADAVIVATLEDERVGPVLNALQQGYHVLVEKPIGRTLDEVIRITDAAQQFDGVFVVCHQMRYVSRYRTIKALIDSGTYGEIVSMQNSENLAFSHMAHSFVRGPFNNSSLSPMILAKSCHDMDLMRWWIGSRPLKVSSFGSLKHFRPENAPKGATTRCLDGCLVESKCPYSVNKLYLQDDVDPAFLRHMGAVENKQQLVELLKTNNYGKCVYRCENDVVDNQVVQMTFEDDITVSFSMCGHNALERRITKISLDRGEIYCDNTDGLVHAHTFYPEAEEIIDPQVDAGTHSGGDRLIMDRFIEAIQTGDKSGVLTTVESTFDGHLMSFAAEESRLTGKIVDVREFEAAARARLTQGA